MSEWWEKIRRGEGVMRLKGSILYFLIFAAFAMTSPFLSLFFENELNLKDWEIGIINGMVPLMAMMVSPLWGLAVDSLQRPRLMMQIGCIGASVGIFLLSFSQGFWIALFLMLLQTSFQSPVTPMLDSAVLETLKSPSSSSSSSSSSELDVFSSSMSEDSSEPVEVVLDQDGKGVNREIDEEEIKEEIKEETEDEDKVSESLISSLSDVVFSSSSDEKDDESPSSLLLAVDGSNPFEHPLDLPLNQSHHHDRNDDVDCDGKNDHHHHLKDDQNSSSHSSDDGDASLEYGKQRLWGAVSWV